MNLSYIVDGLVVGFSASVPLGPIGVLCIQRTLNKGRLSGFISGLGAAMSDTIYAIIAGFSLSFIVGFIETQLLWIQIIGAVILISMGLKIYNTNPAEQLRRQKRNTKTLIQDFFSTFFITIANPLAIFLFLAFFAGLGVVAKEQTMFDQLALILGVFLGAATWWLILTSLISLFRSKINLRRLYWINKIAGGVIVVSVCILFTIWTVKEYFLS